MTWPLVWRSTHDSVERTLNRLIVEAHGAVDQANARVEMQTHNLAEMRRMYDTLMADYRALRLAGADPAPPVPQAPEPPFGPLTRAALHDMGIGQSGMLKRAMSAKTQVIWLEHRGNENQDELTAIAVRQGEVR